jgi:hypothetical protein
MERRRRTPMEELERIEQATDKVADFQKKYNVSQKKIAYIIGKNLTLFVAMLIPLLLVGFIWVDLGAIVLSPKMLSDGIMTVALFVCGEVMMLRLGCDGGRLDTDYVDAKKEFDSAVTKVSEVGSMLLGIFCDWQIDVEMEQAIHYRLRMLRMTPKMWEGVRHLPPEQLERQYGKIRAKKMIELINLSPIELNEAILLYNGEYTARGGVPESGEAYILRKRHIIGTVIACIFTGLLTVTVAITLTSDITIARVIYTVFKLTMLLFRMAKGYDRGARAYNTIEVRQLKAKTKYLNQYVKFIEDKLYLNLGDKYGDISQFVCIQNNENNMQEEAV